MEDASSEIDPPLAPETALALSALAILPHATKPEILLLAKEGSWALPCFVAPTTEDVWDLFELGMHAQSVLGCATETLYCPSYEQANGEHGFRLAFVTANLDAVFQPPEGARWIARNELDDLTLADEHLRPVIQRYFHERATGVYPPERPPWAFAGWTERVKTWIAEQVAAQGWMLAGEIELVRKWCITCVLKVPTSSGDLYFKAVPPTFAREVWVTRFLAEQHPENIPTIVAADDTERWLLLRDFGQAFLGGSKKATDWEQALRAFATLQVKMSGHVDALLHLGALDYRLDTLPEKLDALLADHTILKLNRDVTAEEIERARSLAPRIKALIAELDSYRLPSTIVHSDFHVWNTAVQDGRIIFFDWTDTSVGHPFFDMALFFGAMQQAEVFSDQPEMVARMREVYLQGLASLAPIDMLRKALPLGEILGLAHQAVNYRHLLRSVEPAERWTLDDVGSFMKQLLTKLEEWEKA